MGMSNALREAALYGEEFYEHLRGRCMMAAEAQSLSKNPNFEAPAYSVRRK